MARELNYNIPTPMVDSKESKSLKDLTERYNKMLAPSAAKRLSTKVSGIIPEALKSSAKGVGQTITEAELFLKSMEVLSKGFMLLERGASRVTLDEESVIKQVNQIVPDNEITQLSEICLARSYDISKLVNKYQILDFGIAFIEGGATGAPGLPGLPFNLVLSIFIYYRAVQSIAMFYGYDIKNDPAELEIASTVFSNALSPSNNNQGELSGVIAKVMLISEATTVKQTAKKTWSDMASKDMVTLLLTQMRALANKGVQKTLEKTGKKNLEESLFKNVFEQIGKRLTKKNIMKSIPFISAAIGALIDTAQMKQVLEYANVFYNKRFIMEKKTRIDSLLGLDSDFVNCIETEVIDVK